MKRRRRGSTGGQSKLSSAKRRRPNPVARSMAGGLGGGGFSLDMSEGDERDADFTRVA